jgi:hypothetical protein
MEISIRHAAAMFALALMTLASTAEAQMGETGKLRLTGGVNTVDGVAGGGLTPWAVVGSDATADQVGAAPFGTVVKSKDYQLGTAGAAVGIRDRVELSFVILVVLGQPDVGLQHFEEVMRTPRVPGDARVDEVLHWSLAAAMEQAVDDLRLWA